MVDVEFATFSVMKYSTELFQVASVICTNLTKNLCLKFNFGFFDYGFGSLNRLGLTRLGTMIDIDRRNHFLIWPNVEEKRL